MMRLPKIINIGKRVSSLVKGRHTFVENNAKPWHSLEGSRAVAIMKNGFVGRTYDIVFRKFPRLKDFPLAVIENPSKIG